MDEHPRVRRRREYWCRRSVPSVPIYFDWPSTRETRPGPAVLCMSRSTVAVQADTRLDISFMYFGASSFSAFTIE